MAKCNRMPSEFRTNSKHVIPLLIQDAQDHIDEASSVLARLRSQYDRYSARHGHLRDI